MLPSDHKAFYIDTEGTFLPDRVDSIARAKGLGNDKLLENIMVASPTNTREQEQCIDRFCMDVGQYHSGVKLLIVDSMIALYRHEYQQRSELQERQRKLSKYMHMLQRVARQNRIAVVVTNQVQSYQDRYTAARNLHPLEVTLWLVLVNIESD